MAVRSISLFDACAVKGAREAILQDDLGTFYDMLYHVGFDIDREIEFQDVFCRSMLHPRFITKGRWVSFERRDEDWLNNSLCTLENRLTVVAGKDPSLAKDLEEMSTLPNFMGATLNAMGDLLVEESPEDSYKDTEEDAIDDVLRVSDSVLSVVLERIKEMERLIE